MNKTHIEILALALCEVATRAQSAEAEVERLKADDMSWYNHWQRKDAEAKELADKLSAEVAEHQATKHRLADALGIVDPEEVQS